MPRRRDKHAGAGRCPRYPRRSQPTPHHRERERRRERRRERQRQREREKRQREREKRQSLGANTNLYHPLYGRVGHGA